MIRGGIEIPYATLHGFAVAELGFGWRSATIALLDGESGDELQLDKGLLFPRLRSSIYAHDALSTVMRLPAMIAGWP